MYYFLFIVPNPSDSFHFSQLMYSELVLRVFFVGTESFDLSTNRVISMVIGNGLIQRF